MTEQNNEKGIAEILAVGKEGRPGRRWGRWAIVFLVLTIAAAFLDVTDPEPLPPEHLLWSLDNAHVTMHLSGRSQTLMFHRSAQRFLENLARYRTGEPLHPQVDLALGY